MPQPQLRTIPTVVQDMLAAMAPTCPIGVSVEPIATMMDPSDEINGDYAVRACYDSTGYVSKHLDGQHRYCVIFESSFIIGAICSMPPGDYRRNLRTLRRRAEEFRKNSFENVDSVVVTANDVISMGDVLAKAHREMR